MRLNVVQISHEGLYCLQSFDDLRFATTMYVDFSMHRLQMNMCFEKGQSWDRAVL